ncbi:uncharacterized protein LOC110064177 [Orbicella faveolata]|uniref:uncharacterized protein LOC110064177 n=1 Tax=Orbicella faveolata TaxID=48498 RepID=UPI0009E1C7AA|nr:uncharacterized protein LOC110064177 [Orbicella faveolata]
MSPIVKSSCSFATSSPLISSTPVMLSSPPVTDLSPTPASSTATIATASVSGWTKYSQTISWCTSAGRSLISRGISIIQCQRYCEARPGCNAIEFWERGGRYCYECTDTSKITPYTNSNDWAYPVYVWIKSRLLAVDIDHRIKDRGPRTGDPGQRSQDTRARTVEPGHRSQDRGARTEKPGQRSQYRGARTQNKGSRSKNRTED